MSSRSGYSVRMVGWSVEIAHDGRLVGTGRWTGRQIADRPPLLPGDPLGEAALYRQLEAQLVAAATFAFEALPPAVNDEGVDLLLIGDMLRLSPRERLLTLQENVQ